MSVHTCPIRVSAATRLEAATRSRKVAVPNHHKTNLRSVFLATVLVSLILFAQGCGGGGGGSSTLPSEPEVSQADDGQISIVITDAEGDFVTYAVDVTSLLLEKS
ncbi:MAG: hypothetical protein O7E57_07450, partial [Gammaproteobacteria bacterium]|nr:hypothetical protein [Gammaproteobacteria bacterium]